MQVRMYIHNKYINTVLSYIYIHIHRYFSFVNDGQMMMMTKRYASQMSGPLLQLPAHPQTTILHWFLEVWMTKSPTVLLVLQFKWQIFYIFGMEITVKKNPYISNQITISFTLVKLRWFVSRAAGSIHNRLDNLKYYSDMLSFAEFESFYFIMNIFMKIEVWQ